MVWLRVWVSLKSWLGPPAIKVLGEASILDVVSIALTGSPGLLGSNPETDIQKRFFGYQMPPPTCGMRLTITERPVQVVKTNRFLLLPSFRGVSRVW